MQYFIDFEATQFSERIISIGCIAANGETFKTLVQPVKKKDKVNAFITQLTGITNEMLSTAPTADEAFNAFFDFVLENKDDDAPEYFCYGNADKQFIERTVSHMTDTRAVTFARSLQYLLQDYSVKVKSHFQIHTEIALRKAYMLIQNEEIEQHHDALEDARMLYAVARNLKTCSPKEAVKLASMKKVEKPLPCNRLKNAPAQFLAWPADKWAADTGADETNWVIKATVGPRIKYFDSETTAMLWLLRYMTKGMSVKNLTHQQMVRERIRIGINTDKQSYGFAWESREVENVCEGTDCGIAEVTA